MAHFHVVTYMTLCSQLSSFTYNNLHGNIIYKGFLIQSKKFNLDLNLIFPPLIFVNIVTLKKKNWLCMISFEVIVKKWHIFTFIV